MLLKALPRHDDELAVTGGHFVAVAGEELFARGEVAGCGGGGGFVGA